MGKKIRVYFKRADELWGGYKKIMNEMEGED